jgi:hypothetical protein
LVYLTAKLSSKKTLARQVDSASWPYSTLRNVVFDNIMKYTNTNVGTSTTVAWFGHVAFSNSWN